MVSFDFIGTLRKKKRKKGMFLK